VTADLAAQVAVAECKLQEEETEAATRIRADSGPLLAFVSNLLASVRVVLTESGIRIPDTLCGVVANSLYAKI
jgi:hypothetical protein